MISCLDSGKTGVGVHFRDFDIDESGSSMSRPDGDAFSVLRRTARRPELSSFSQAMNYRASLSPPFAHRSGTFSGPGPIPGSVAARR